MTTKSMFPRPFQPWLGSLTLKNNYCLSAIFLGAAMTLLTGSEAKAASGSWGVDTAGNWGSSANWTTGTIADGASSTANLSFNITGNRIITLDSARTIGIVNIGDSNSTHSYTLATGSNTLTFNNGASSAQLNQSSTSKGDTISGLLAIGGNGTLTVANNASFITMTISANISSGLASGTQTLAFNNANTVTYSGAISNGVLGGTLALTKAGAGTTTLSNAANTYTGSTSVSAGTLTISGTNTTSAVTLSGGTLNANNAAAIGSGTLTISGGTLNNSSAAAIMNTGNNAQAWNGSFAYGATQAYNIGTGAVTLGSANTTITVNGTGLNSAGALTVGGNISGTGKGLTKDGVGTLILSGTNGYDGGSTINGGVLQFASGSALGAGSNNVAVNYGGTVAFGAAVTQANLTGSLVSGSKGTVALAADSSNNLDFSAAGLGNLSLGASTGNWVYSGALTSAGSVYRLGGGGGTLTFNPALTGSNSLLVGGSGSGGSVSLANAGTYSGGTIVTGGIGSGGAALGSIGGGSILQTNVLAGASTTPFGSNAAITLNNGALGLGTAGVLSGGQVVTASGYDLTYNGQNAINLAAGSGNVNFAANTLNRVNRGILLLNSTSGATLGTTEKVTVASGTPTVTNNMVAANYINGTTHNFLNYDANGFKDAVFTKTSMSAAGATDIVSLNGSTVSTAFGGNRVIYALKVSNTTTFNANAIGEVNETVTILSGGLILESIGAGSGYNFSADHTRASVNFGTAEAMIGTFTTASALASQSGTWMGTGGLTSYGNGILAINSMSLTGGITVAGGTLRTLNNGAFVSSNSLTVDRAGIFQFGGNNLSNQFVSLAGEGGINTGGSTGDALVIDGFANSGLSTTFGGVIQDNVALTKNGLSTQVLTGANRYTGATTVNGGTLRLDFSAAGAPATNIINNSSNSSALALGGGKLDIVGAASGTSSQQFNGLTVNAGDNAIALTAGAAIPTVTLGATLTRNVGGTLNVTDATGSHVSTAATTTSTSGILSASGSNPTAFATVNGTDWAAISGGAIAALSSYATNDFATATNNTDVTSNQGPATFTVNSLRFNTAGTTLTLTGTNTVTTGGILTTAATAGVSGNTATITGGTLKSNAGNELVLINNGQLTVNSVIANGAAASALTLSGSGTTTLNGANTYTGNTYVNSGTIAVGNANALGASGTVNLNGGSLQSTSALTIARAVSLNNNTIIGGSNDLTLSGAFSNSRSSNILTVNNTANTTLSGAMGLGGTTLNVAGSGNLNASGVISNGNVTYSGTGSLALSNVANTYSGVTKVTSGTINVSTLANGGVNSNLGASTNVATNLVLDGGTLKYTGAGSSTDRLFSVGASGGTIDASGSGALNLTNAGAVAFNSAPGTRTLTLTGTSTAANTITPIIGDHINYYSTGVTKAGTGKWVLAGANTYTGATNVNGGTLIVNGSIAAGSAVTVANNATLGGSGTIAGNTTVQSGGTVSPGNSPGVLVETGNLTFETGSHFNFELTSDTASLGNRGTAFDGVNVTGAGILTIQSGVDFNLALNVGTVDFSSSFWNADQNWTVFSNANTASTVAGIFTLGSVSNDSLGASFATTGGSFFFSTSGNDVLLNYTTVPEPSTYVLLGLGLGSLWFLRRRKTRA